MPNINPNAINKRGHRRQAIYRHWFLGGLLGRFSTHQYPKPAASRKSDKSLERTQKVKVKLFFEVLGQPQHVVSFLFFHWHLLDKFFAARTGRVHHFAIFHSTSNLIACLSSRNKSECQRGLPSNTASANPQLSRSNKTFYCLSRAFKLIKNVSKKSTAKKNDENKPGPP